MSAKAVLVLCAQALFIQLALSQCTGRAAIDASGIGAPFGWTGSTLGAPGLAYNGLVAPGVACNGLAGGLAPGLASGLGAGFGGLDMTPTSGGALAVTSSSAIAPTGISVVSENVFEGALSVAGELPFVGTTGMEGALPTAGAGAINHACGDGHVAMISEATIAPTSAVFGPAATVAGAGLAPGLGFGPAATVAGTGLAPGLGFGPAALGPAAFGPAALGPAALSPASRLGLGGCGHGVLH